MNTQRIGELIKLRYKLLWAKVRSRNGKIALFLAGYFLLIFFGALFSLGGIGAGIAAVRSGKAYLMTGGVLGGLYLQAIIATVILGFGVNAVFADTELRRYPLKARERRFARHFLGIIDPFWLLILALELGLAVGLYLVGAASFFLAIFAVLLLYVSNYMLARVIALLIERVAVKRGGSAILLGLVLLLSFLPTLLGPVIKKNRHALEPLLHALAYTPPAGAAAAAVRSGFDALYGFAIVVWWILGLAAVLAALERHPPKRKVAQTTVVTFEDRWDRIGAFFGPYYGPLVAQWLRFYSRNNRFRTIYPLAVPLVAFLGFTQARVASPQAQYANILGCFALVGCIGTVQFAVNQFGYTGGGLRRYLLLPADPATILRAGSYAFVSAGALLIPVGAVIALKFSPVPLDAARLMMMLGAALTALFFMHGMALWATLYGPRRGNFYGSFGNDLSLYGNLVVMIGAVTMLFLPRLLVKLWPGVLADAHWWFTPLLAAVSAAFYFVSLDKAGAAFRGRRERILAVIEGRNS